MACNGQHQTAGKTDPQRDFMAAHGIVSSTAYETDCQGNNEFRLSETHYNDSGEEIGKTSYFLGGNIFSNTTQTYTNGLMTEKIYLRTETNPYSLVRYEYNDRGQKVKYAIFDSLDNRLSLHKIERKGNKECISDYDANGKLTNYRIIAYDSLEHPLVFNTRKIRYTYNNQSLMTEMAEVDTISGMFKRTVFEYRNVLLAKQTIYYNDTCKSVIRYEYKKASGEKW
jgi:hypothetical protein